MRHPLHHRTCLVLAVEELNIKFVMLQDYEDKDNV